MLIYDYTTRGRAFVTRYSGRPNHAKFKIGPVASVIAALAPFHASAATIAQNCAVTIKPARSIGNSETLFGGAGFWALMIAGFAGLDLAGYRRAKTGRASFAS